MSRIESGSINTYTILSLGFALSALTSVIGITYEHYIGGDVQAEHGWVGMWIPSAIGVTIFHALDKRARGG